MILQLTPNQWSQVIDSYVLCMLGLFAAAFYGLATQSRLLFRYRHIMVLAALLCLIDVASYLQLILTFTKATTDNAVLLSTGNLGFSNISRYSVWVIAVPLQVNILISVLMFDTKLARSLKRRSTIMIIGVMLSGFLGENWPQYKVIFGCASTIVFIFVIALLFKPFQSSLDSQTDEVASLFRQLRLYVINLWCTYPALYFLSFAHTFTSRAATFFVAQQVILAIVDLISKAYFALQIFKIAQLKSISDGMPDLH